MNQIQLELCELDEERRDHSARQERIARGEATGDDLVWHERLVAESIARATEPGYAAEVAGKVEEHTRELEESTARSAEKRHRWDHASRRREADIARLKRMYEGRATAAGLAEHGPR